MEEIEYKDNEKVLYKTRGKLSLPHKEPEEADCLVTDGHIVIETAEPIKIALSRMIGCHVDLATGGYDYSSYSAGAQISVSSTVTLTFMDDQYSERKLTFKAHAANLYGFKETIDKQIVGRFIGIAEEYRRNGASGEFFSGIKEGFRDHTRDNICTDLQRLGIDAQMAPRGRPEEEVYIKRLPDIGSLGIICIPEGPIRWVNVRKETSQAGPGTTSYYYTEYGVPDPRLGPDFPGARIETVRVKTSPLFGRVVDLRWKGSDSELGIISHLNSDHQLKQPIMKSRDVTIRSVRDYGCWVISTERHHATISSLLAKKRDVLSGELWSCYQAIARHLLAEWSPSK